MVFKSDKKLLAEVRQKFSAAPIGKWFSYFGGGEDVAHGCAICFEKGGSGTYHSWGDGPGGEGAAEFPLKWRPVGEQRIRLQLEKLTDPASEWCLVNYDFYLKRNEYKNLQIYIFEIGKVPVSHSERGFWICPYPLQISAAELQG